MSLTDTQLEAIAARGNVLVVAGAGTGKTRTLVERCLRCLLAEEPRASLEEILMVTFTEAAAAEMRERIRRRLQEEAQRDPRQAHSQEQLALFETARIGTLHSFCLQLVRQHFYELELDPQLSVLPEEESRLLAEETLDNLLRKYYAGRGSAAESVQQLIQAHGRGRDKPIRALILRLHHYSQTLPDAAGWLRRQLDLYASPQPGLWREWLPQAIAGWRERWQPALERLAHGNDLARACADTLAQLPAQPSPAAAAPILEAIHAACKNCPHGKRARWLDPLEDFHRDTKFLLSLMPPAKSEDPLGQDWGWVRGQLTTLLQLAQQFTAAFTEAKRELGLVDFHDLEQCALRLLWDTRRDQPTPIALEWRKKLRFIFVDEYQDINAAQDKIIEALSRTGPQANRFLVGDVKQSIYRFRLANPHIFQGYVSQWTGTRGRAIPLVDNFRSREGLLRFINSCFGLLMQPEMGGVRYDDQARLRFGAPAERAALSVATDPAPCVELHLRVKTRPDAQDADEEAADSLAPIEELEDTEKEARLVALRLLELKRRRQPVGDQTTGQFRPVDWGDIAVLLRSPSAKAEIYAKAFARLDVPLQVVRGGFYESLEISDLLNLLQVLDNPLQDVPVLGVLHSPLVGLGLNELATIRLAALKTHFWTALVRWAEAAQSPGAAPGASSGAETDTRRKVATFLDRFARWRRLARQVSLSRCLEAVLAETHYATWLLTQPRGQQRHANVQRFVAMAQEFDQFQRQGLFRFLRFIEAQQSAATEPDVPAASSDNAVRLMSIHQSKGLEFPVVVLPDLAKPFNLADLRAEIILDDQYGLCPQIQPPHTGKRYPSLPYWLARAHQTRELLGEELRLLYVAMTRARDLLLLTGTVSQTRFDKFWLPGPRAETLTPLDARSYADWLAFWFAQNISPEDAQARQGATADLRWQIHETRDLVGPEKETPAAEPAAFTIDPDRWGELQRRLSWEYPFRAATTQPAKTTVSALRRQAAVETEEAAWLWPEGPSQAASPPEPKAQPAPIANPIPAATAPLAGGLRTTRHHDLPTAAEIGNAHHKFLQLVSLEHTGSVMELRSDAERLAAAKCFSPAELELLDFNKLAAFWNSSLGRRIRSQAHSVHREMAFTARFTPVELAQFTNRPADPGLKDEHVVVQGVADLVVILPREIWLVDFKTDAVAEEGMKARAEAYAPQLRLYARALSRIYRRPVTECWLYFFATQTPVAIDPTPC